MLKIRRYLVVFELYRSGAPQAASVPYHTSKLLEQRRRVTGEDLEAAQIEVINEFDLDYTPPIYKCDLIH